MHVKKLQWIVSEPYKGRKHKQAGDIVNNKSLQAHRCLPTGTEARAL